LIDELKEPLIEIPEERKQTVYTWRHTRYDEKPQIKKKCCCCISEKKKKRKRNKVNVKKNKDM